MSATSTNLGQRISGLGTRLWVLILLLSVVIFGANFAFQSYLDAKEVNAELLAAEVQVESQRLGNFAQLAADGDEAAFAKLAESSSRLQSVVQALSIGSIDENVDGYKNDQMAPLASASVNRLEEAWNAASTDADRIVSSREQLLSVVKTGRSFVNNVPRLSARLDEVVKSLADANAPASQISLANRQVVIANRMAQSVTEILAGGENSEAALTKLTRDENLFNSVLNGFKQGNPDLNVSRVTSAASINAVDEAIRVYEEAKVQLDEVSREAPNVAAVQESGLRLATQTGVLLDEAKVLGKAIQNINLQRLFPNNYIAVGGAIALIVSLIGLLVSFFSEGRKRERLATELNQRNQEAILRLLDEMGSLADGDLTVKATVTEDITGAIADSINFAVDALRNLVSTINETAVQVAAAAQETQATAMHLAEAAEHQAQQITSASARINDIASSIDEVSKNSAESADVAKRSVQIAAKGAEVVRQTIRGMDNIRDQIQETSKRIKRLGESSQEIGSIIELINDISEQTNILALNAAIQAASAGEAGRGFAVVADEVQRLAERASNATKRIETLVQTIQSDTNEAVSSMEQTTAEVVAGARLAEDAGLALGEIEKVSNDLADLIQNISEAAKQQSAAATNITGTMTVIQEITTQTSQGASQTAESIGNLAQLAADLRRSVADFKLPE